MSSQNPAPAYADPWIGYKVNDFVIKARLGSGGMGTVYLLHPIPKSVSPSNCCRACRPVRIQQLMEARVTGINDPHVITMLNFGTVDGPMGPALFLIMGIWRVSL